MSSYLRGFFLALGVLVVGTVCGESANSVYGALEKAFSKPNQMRFIPKGTESLQLHAIRHPEKPYLVGAEHSIEMDVSVKDIFHFLESVEVFKKIFPGVEDVSFVEKKEKNWKLHWKQKAPYALLSSTDLELHYSLVDFDKPLTGRLYFYRMEKGQNIELMDGLMFVQELGPKKSLFWEVDFWEPSPQAFRSLFKETIWTDTLEDDCISDYAMKFYLETKSDELRRTGSFQEQARTKCKENKYSEIYSSAVTWDTWIKNYLAPQ